MEDKLINLFCYVICYRELIDQIIFNRILTSQPYDHDIK